jgi:hypothetical protein
MEISRLWRRLSGLQVEETAACTRALTALVGREPLLDLLPGGPAAVPRAALTARVLLLDRDLPWPAALSRQLDPRDPAFLPPLGLHPVLAARDLTRLVVPGHPGHAWVDPQGWCGVGEGPGVSVWFGTESAGWCTGAQPGEGAPPPACLDHHRSDAGVGVRTVSTRGPLRLHLVHWPTVLAGQPAWALSARLENIGAEPIAARIGFVLRPAGPEGVAPVFHLQRDAEGRWSADGRPILALSRAGDTLLLGRHGERDPWHRFVAGGPDPLARPPAPVDHRCPAGLASAVELATVRLEPGQSHARIAVLAPPPAAPATLVRTSGPTLWENAHTDRRGLLAAGCAIELRPPSAAPPAADPVQRVFEAARVRLLGEPDAADLPAFLGAVALSRLGFVRRAGQRLGDHLDRVRKDGRLPGASPEEGAVLAWAAAAHARWSGDTAWVREHLEGWVRLLRAVRDTPVEPGGRAFFGPEGSARWSAIWRTAALLDGAAALRDWSPVHADVALAGGRAREALPGLLGPAPWTAAPGRAVDGSAAALLAAAWLGVVPSDDPAVSTTLGVMQARFRLGDGVLLMGGAHVGVTALAAAVWGRQNPGRNPLPAVAGLASPTGALPSVRHPARGALGDGDDALSAALFVLLALDRVLPARGRLRVLPGVWAARDLPTPFGRIDIEADAAGRRVVVGRWSGVPPQVEVVAPAAEGDGVAEGGPPPSAP